jgi:hypothetical protein
VAATPNAYKGKISPIKKYSDNYLAIYTNVIMDLYSYRMPLVSVALPETDDVTAVEFERGIP